MANKTLQEYRKYYRKNHPTWSDNEVELNAQAAFKGQELGNTERTGANPVIGRENAGTNPVPNTPSTGGSTLPSITSTWSTNINNRLSDARIQLAPSSSQQQASLVDSFTKPQLTNIAKVLKSLGYSKSQISTGMKVKDILVSDFGTTLAASKTYNDFTNTIAADVLSGLNTDATANVPTQTIQKYDPIVLEKLIDNIYQETLGQPATESQKRLRMGELNRMIEEGTTTTTKKVGGKNVVTVTPGFSQERAKTSIEEQLKVMNPDEFDRKKRIDFQGWLSQNVAGA
jgi:hypothetical protein